MRSQYILAAITAISLASPALAAEPGTYRPGTPYYSSEAGSSEICESQCSGDAQCRGWNFVKISPSATSGVCEFNSMSAAPVPSTISISGDNDGRSYARSISSGGTNTVRVGAPLSAKQSAQPVLARTAQRPINPQTAQNLSPETVRPGARAIQPGQPRATAAQRRVVRQPIPQSMQPGAATYQRPAGRPARNTGLAPRQPVQNRPQFQHNLDETLPARAPRVQQPAMAPQMRPVLRPHMPSAGMGDPRLQRMLREQAARPAQTPNPASIPPQMPPGQRAAVSAPPAMPMAAPPAHPKPAPAAQPPQPPQSLADAEQSLFGSLHDDVVAPKPVSPEAVANPDAPIATGQAVPVKKITVENLMGLAGGPGE